MDNTKIQNKAMDNAPKNKGKKIVVVEPYCGIEKGTEYPEASFDKGTIRDMKKKGLWKIK